MSVVEGLQATNFLLCLVVLGVILHVGYFRRFEHHMHGVRHLQVGLLAFTTTFLALLQIARITYLAALVETIKWTFAILLGLYSSLLTYRIFLHPLRNFPGPFIARATHLWFSVHTRNADAHKKLVELHRKYGPIVRFGPSDLSIAHPQGTEAIYGPKSQCRKGHWYDEDWPRCSIHTSRDPAYHRNRRRTWSKAFSDKQLRNYEQRVVQYNTILIERLKGRGGAAVDASHWLHWWAFDIMGDLTFGKDFGMLQSGQQHWAVELFCEAMKLQALHLPTWLVRMIVAVPGMTSTYWKFINFCDEQMYERIKSQPEVPDLSSALLPTLEKSSDETAELISLLADSRTAIVAGSDTTAAALVHIVYYLAKFPQHAQKIRDELGDFNSADEGLDNVKLQKLDHLNAVINETLRLHPVVPSIMPRKTPVEGIAVGEHFIPGGVNVCSPQYVLARDDTIYAHAENFIPERWYSHPELVKVPGAYAPFSSGVYACIGRPLALLELRTVISSLLLAFQISFAPGQTGEKFIRDTKDHFTLALAELPICFEPRKATSS